MEGRASSNVKRAAGDLIFLSGYSARAAGTGRPASLHDKCDTVFMRGERFFLITLAPAGTGWGGGWPAGTAVHCLPRSLGNGLAGRAGGGRGRGRVRQAALESAQRSPDWHPIETPPHEKLNSLVAEARILGLGVLGLHQVATGREARTFSSPAPCGARPGPAQRGAARPEESSSALPTAAATRPAWRGAAPAPLQRLDHAWAGPGRAGPWRTPARGPRDAQGR